MKLRSYQQRVVEEARNTLRDNRGVLLVLPTGSGKTVIGAHIANAAMGLGHRVLWMVHKRELVYQAAAKLTSAGIVMAGVKRRNAPIQVVSIQTFGKRKRQPAELIVIDEAHHAAASTWRQILDSYPNAKVIGLTATPERGDGSNLGDIFQSMVVGPTVQELTNDGHLVPCEVVGPPEETKTLSHRPAAAWRVYGGEAQGFIFAASVAHSKAIAHEIGPDAAHVDGNTPAKVRDTIINHFRSGDVRVLCSAQIFTEGVDLPMASVAVLARGCSHPSTYLQMVGRVLRPWPGKQFARVVDLRGVTHRFGLPSDNREYGLEGKAIRKVDALPHLRQCLACGAVWRAGRDRQPCMRCGREIPEMPLPKVKERRMGPLRPHARQVEREANYRKWQLEDRARGYKKGRARMKYRAVYGVWP